ncbi:hypothetical protein E2C01_050331 [Portunus trituberculatus]|uniref:Uncharacterized protein n=1 Tax=Portunus trituberculatus TaxID=210409 RepID=A0A5B7G8P0_PORTR|nr:hypothetical protein [Portunus trituberculatus]
MLWSKQVRWEEVMAMMVVMVAVVVVVVVLMALVVMEVVVIVLPQSILHNLPPACVLIMRPGASLRL